MSLSNAWLLECGASLAIAVADREMMELVQGARCHAVPGTPAYCSKILLWQNEAVPVMDLQALHTCDVQRSSADTYLCLLNYQQEPNTPLRQLAVPVARAPERIRIDDAQACELPREFDHSPLRAVTLSCFTHHANSVLILDLAALCSTGFRDLANAA